MTTQSNFIKNKVLAGTAINHLPTLAHANEIYRPVKPDKKCGTPVLNACATVLCQSRGFCEPPALDEFPPAYSIICCTKT